VAGRLDGAADELVPLAAQETHLGVDRLQGELKRTTFQLRLFAEVLGDGSFLQATIDHADPNWPMGPRPDLNLSLVPSAADEPCSISPSPDRNLSRFMASSAA
jgi:NADP-dependent aldehyde dehydrogenase